ncbi:hypothetical protein GQ54DRAFT_224880 [Martensiomyces pterosporus]|nr:hypothetical protein GQ54DRAFT_224880 [Martensiomyces pterosporus]
MVKAHMPSWLPIACGFQSLPADSLATTALAFFNLCDATWLPGQVDPPPPPIHRWSLRTYDNAHPDSVPLRTHTNTMAAAATVLSCLTRSGRSVHAVTCVLTAIYVSSHYSAQAIKQSEIPVFCRRQRRRGML